MTKTNSPTPEVFDLTIDSLSFNGGRGVGRFNGIVTFVPGTAPGDRARVRVTARKAKFIEAELVALLEPSPERRVPPCPVFGRCGGCVWQHLTYGSQVRQKEKILADAFRRRPARETLPFLAAPAEFGYRNRVQVHVEGDAWGFFAAGSHRVVPTDRCLIAEDAINAELARRRPAEFPGARRVEFARGFDGETRVMVDQRDPGAALFAQVNAAQNEVLKARITALTPPEVDWFADLYAGAGNLTGPLVTKYTRAHGRAVEYSRASVARGRAAWPTVEWFAGDVGKTLPELKARNGPGLVLLDPPRAGVEAEVIAALVLHRPVEILYVSCNPSTLARDAERLVATGDYTLAQIQGLDMFPQTEHVEVIARFTRQSGV